MCVAGGAGGDEMGGQGGNVEYALAQRRDRERDHGQAQFEVPAEAPLGDLGPQVLGSGGDDPRCAGCGSPVGDRDRMVEPRLIRWTEVPDLIQVQGPDDRA